MDSSDNRVLVTGVPGRVGGVGSAIVDILRRRDLPVRALVLREDQRTDALRANGVDVVVGNLTQARDVAGALSGCRRMYFGCVCLRAICSPALRILSPVQPSS